MLSCVAAKVLERGYTVLALTSARLIELLKRNLYSDGTDMERLYSVDLLLIDELGMEPMLNNVTIESLFAVINERLRRRKRDFNNHQSYSRRYKDPLYRKNSLQAAG